MRITYTGGVCVHTYSTEQREKARYRSPLYRRTPQRCVTGYSPLFPQASRRNARFTFLGSSARLTPAARPCRSPGKLRVPAPRSHLYCTVVLPSVTADVVALWKIPWSANTAARARKRATLYEHQWERKPTCIYRYIVTYVWPYARARLEPQRATKRSDVGHSRIIRRNWRRTRRNALPPACRAHAHDRVLYLSSVYYHTRACPTEKRTERATKENERGREWEKDRERGYSVGVRGQAPSSSSCRH